MASMAMHGGRLQQGAAFDLSEEAAEKMMENIAELETRGFTLDRPTSLPAEAVPQQDRHMSSRGMRGRCGASPVVWQRAFVSVTGVPAFVEVACGACKMESCECSETRMMYVVPCKKAAAAASASALVRIVCWRRWS